MMLKIPNLAMLSGCLLLFSCTTGSFYDSTASLPHIAISKKSNLKVVSLDNSFMGEISFGVIAGTDQYGGKRIDYVLIAPCLNYQGVELENYDLNNSSLLTVRHTQELIAFLEEVMEIIRLERISRDGVYMTYAVTPENLLRKTGDSSIEYRPTFNFRFQRTKGRPNADFLIGREHLDATGNKIYITHYNYVFESGYLSPLDKGIENFKSLLTLALQELQKK